MELNISQSDIHTNPYAREKAVNTIFLVATITMGSIGTIGNTLVIGGVFSYKRLRVTGNTFVVNLAVADLCVSLFINTFGTFGLLSNGDFLLEKPYLCELIGIVCITSCSCSMWSIAAISLNRYISICHRLVYPHFYNRKTIPLMVISLWIICFSIDSPNLFGWGAHAFDPKIMLCTYDYTKAYSYTFFFIITGFGIPLATVTCSYIGILKYARSTGKDIRKMTKKQKNEHTSKQLKDGDRKLLRSVFTIVLVFLFMWAPYAIIVVFDVNAVWPRWMYVVAVVMAHMNSCINCLLYAATNQHFRSGYWMFIKLVFCCPKGRSSFKNSSKARTISSGTDSESDRNRGANFEVKK